MINTHALSLCYKTPSRFLLSLFLHIHVITYTLLNSHLKVFLSLGGHSQKKEGLDSGPFLVSIVSFPPPLFP